MDQKKIVPLVVALTMGLSSTVFAQQPGGPDNHGPGPGEQHGNPHNAPHGGPQHGGPQRGGPVHDAPMARNGGPVPHEDWHKGDRLPAEYRDNNYVVDDWHDHDLQAPPRGYHWVSVNGDYVLAAVATGVILNVLASGH